MSRPNSNTRPSPAALKRIRWKPLVLGKHFPDDFNDGKFLSEPGETYPIDVVVALDTPMNIYKVVLDVDEQHLPSKVAVRVGLGDVNLEVNYKNARLAKYQKPVVMEYFRRQKNEHRVESRSAFIDAIGQYIWITVHAPFGYESNPGLMVSIRGLEVFGYTISKKIKNEMKEMSDKMETVKEDEKTGNYFDDEEFMKKSEEASDFESEGDGLTTTNDGILAGDPLTSIRTIKANLKTRMARANREGRVVEATVCLRGIQRLEEYETRVEDLAARRSDALQLGDLQMVESGSIIDWEI